MEILNSFVTEIALNVDAKNALKALQACETETQKLEVSTEFIQKNFKLMTDSINNLSVDQLKDLDSSLAEAYSHVDRTTETAQVMRDMLAVINEAKEKKIGDINEDLEKDQKGNKTLEYLKTFGLTFKNKISDDVNRNLGAEGMAGKVYDVVKKGIEAIKTLISSGWEELTNIASYDLANSYTYNETAWSTMLTYGTSSAQSYAINKTMTELGISNEDDLYQAMMSENFQKKWAERIGYYTDKYNSLADSGMLQTIQEFTLEFEEFKTDFQYQVMDWFVDNKDVIMGALNLGMQLMEGILNAVSGIANFLGINSPKTDTEQKQAAIEVLNSHANNVTTNNTNNTTNNNTVNLSNSFASGDYNAKSIISKIYADVKAALG